jgi:hypothetical protein
MYDCCPYPLFRDLDVVEHSAQPGQGHTHSQLAPPPHPTQPPSYRTRIPPSRLLTPHASHPAASSPHMHPTAPAFPHRIRIPPPSSCSISTGSSTHGLIVCINVCCSRIHERTISLRFLVKILRVFRLEVFVYNVYITNQFQTTFEKKGWGEGVKSFSRGDCE